jgi:hypothetical protein
VQVPYAAPSKALRRFARQKYPHFRIGHREVMESSADERQRMGVWKPAKKV